MMNTGNSPILVTGAPGNVGTAVVKGLRDLAMPVRVGARRPEAAQKILGNDLDYVRFDFLDPATFGPTFTGIEQMFLVRPPALANVKRDIAPALNAAKAAGVKHIVFLSLQGVEKNRVVPHYKIEQHILELGITQTFLRAGFFMQNLSTTLRDEIRDKHEIGVPVGKAKTSFIDVRDIAAVAVRALTESGHDNVNYTLTGSEALDYYQVAEIISAAVGYVVRYTKPSIIGYLRRQLAAGTVLDFALLTAALYTITRFGNAKTVTDDVQTVLGRPPITFSQFANDYQTAWQAGPR